jgi:hypothetical protein
VELKETVVPLNKEEESLLEEANISREEEEAEFVISDKNKA